MSVQVLQNGGILFNDSLDRLRGDAIVACQSGIPEDLVYYLRALERAYLDKLHQDHLRYAQEIGWKHQDPKP